MECVIKKGTKINIYKTIKLENEVRKQLSRINKTYFLEKQGFPVNDDFTFETEDGDIAFIDHHENIILNDRYYDFIDWLDENFKNKRSVLVNSLAGFLHLKNKVKK